MESHRNSVPKARTLAWRRLLVLSAAAAALAGPAVAQEDLPNQAVTALHSAFGAHHARAVHAKGIVMTGRFDPDPGARRLSRAAMFRRPIPVIVRFSDFTGLPDIPDNSGGANPRGMAIKFGTVDDATMDVVAHSFNGFPVKTAAEFAELFRAVGASGPDAPKPTRLDGFLSAHPVAKTFLTSQKPPPASFATTAYFGVNAFSFIDAHGRAVPVRYRFVPGAGEHYLEPAAATARGGNYLSTEIAARVAAAPILFTWYAQLGEPSDKLDDPSVAWPETRRLVKLGTIRIDRLASDQSAMDKQLIFLPGRVPAGVVPADPMIEVRTAAYPISFGERQ